MKFKKSLITLAAASSVALAGVPAAVADEAPEAPTASATATQPAADEAAPAEDATAGDDQAEADDEAEAGETADENAEGTENEGSTEEGTQGSIDDEKKEKLKGSIDNLAGWDETTSTLDKVKDVIGFIGKIVKIFL